MIAKHGSTWGVVGKGANFNDGCDGLSSAVAMPQIMVGRWCSAALAFLGNESGRWKPDSEGKGIAAAMPYHGLVGRSCRSAVAFSGLGASLSQRLAAKHVDHSYDPLKQL